MTNSVPEGYSTVTPSLVLKDAARAIETYKKAFGAKVIDRMEMPDGSGKIMHATIKIGNSIIMLGDEWPGCPSSGGARFYLYMPDVDVAMKQAQDAGLKETMPAQNMFWGDRLGAMSDEFGIEWSVATHIRDVSPEELEKGAKEMMNQMKAA